MSAIQKMLEGREVTPDQIAGKTVRAFGEHFGMCEVISFTDGTFLWLDDNNDWRWHGDCPLVASGVLTPEEAAQWDAERTAEREREERARDLAELARLKAKYEGRS